MRGFPILRPILAGLLVAGMAGAGEMGPDGLANLGPADIVLLGEVHDNPAHHDGQAEALVALAPAAIVFEMLTEAQADAVTPGLREDPGALAGTLGWAESGWPDFSMYHPLFMAVPGALILGGAVPRDVVRQAIAEGAAAALGKDAGRLGLDLPFAEDQQVEAIAELKTAHCDALPPEMLPGMLEAQRLRDAQMAAVALAALDETGGPVAVITGNGHARRDRGVPMYLRTARPSLRVVSLGQLEERTDGAPPFDVWRVTAPAEREDPCAAFAR